MRRISQLRLFPNTEFYLSERSNAIFASNRHYMSPSAPYFYATMTPNTVKYFQYKPRTYDDEVVRNRLISVLDQICLDTKLKISKTPVWVKKEKLKTNPQFASLLARLTTFQANREESSKLLEEILPQMLKLLPVASQSQRVSLFTVLADKNIREMDFIQAVAQSFCSGKQHLYIEESAALLTAIASLTFYDAQLISLLKSNFFFYMKNSKKYSTKPFTQIIRSFSKLKITDENLWAAVVDYILDISKRSQYEKLVFRDISITLTACCTSNIANIERLLPCANKIDNLVVKTMSRSSLLTIAHSFASAQFLMPKLTSLLLNKTFIKALTRDMQKGESPKITCYYNVMRLFNIATAVKMESDNAKENLNEADQRFLKNLHFFNPIKSLIDSPEKLKYSMDMTVVDKFRQLLQNVVPLETHLSRPYVHEDTGVLVEGNIVVCNNEVVPLETVTEEATVAGTTVSNAPVTVAVLFFTKNHTTRPDSDLPEHLSKVRLMGSSQMAVRFLQKNKKSNCFPVVFTEIELEALADDEQRKALILERITRLSTKYHEV